MIYKQSSDKRATNSGRKKPKTIEEFEIAYNRVRRVIESEKKIFTAKKIESRLIKEDIEILKKQIADLRSANESLQQKNVSLQQENERLVQGTTKHWRNFQRLYLQNHKTENSNQLNVLSCTQAREDRWQWVANQNQGAESVLHGNDESANLHDGDQKQKV